ncbi:MAG: mechanosensitive ion channel family protein [Sphingobacteriaceae bacterium]|nr:MAG: mechanosensitive ion channel family protein [Sphingobacteriaceae bacterium]
MPKKYLFLLICFVCSKLLSAQNQIDVKHSDSVKNAHLIRQSVLLEEFVHPHKSDSLKKATLQQLQNIAPKDSANVFSLVRQLQTIRQSDSVRVSHQLFLIDSLKQKITGYSVMPFDKVLFAIYSPSGGFSPQERAKTLMDKIKKIAKNAFDKDSLKINLKTIAPQILYKGVLIFAADTTDALWMKTSKQHLVSDYRNRIAAAIISNEVATSWITLLEEAALAVLVILLLTFFIYLVNRFYKKVRLLIKQQRGKKIKGINIKDYELFNASMQIDVLLFLSNIFRWLLISLLVYLALPLLFGIFPWTKGIANTMLGYFLNPAKKIVLAFWHYLPNLFTIIVIITVFRYFLKGIKYLKEEIEKGRLKIGGFYPDWADPTYQIIRVLVLAFMVIVIFPYLPGSDSLAFKGVSVFLGVLFTFGSAGPLGNLVSGLVLTYMRSFKIGDRIRINDVIGDIIEETLLVVRIKTIKNEIISIPNSAVLSSHTINYSSESAQDGLVLNTKITMGYNTPWRQVHQLLIDAALATEFIQSTPSPYVLQTGLDDYYVSYQINAYTKEAGQQDLIYSKLYENIQDNFNKAGLELLSPHYRVIQNNIQKLPGL